MEIEGDLKTLDQIIRAAGDKLMSFYRRDDLRVTQKKDDSLVTEADLASEKVIIDALTEHFPGDKIYSEEAGLSSADRHEGSYIWIVDPLDGTTNFSNHYPFFCVSMGRGVFTKDGKIEIVQGGVYDPVREECFLAERGRGASCNGRDISVRPDRPPEEGFIVTGFSYHKGPELEVDVNRFLRVAEVCQSIRRDGAAALDLAYVAYGIYDGYWEFGLRPWDIAAGSLIVQEAGGYVYDTGRGADSFDPESDGILCGTRSMSEYLRSKM
ncbi:inositol monophosphatase family protein [Pseudobacteriovorax antillogorgiicola]|uniref:Inositol-1-monophosphatase n=1 Tax=Pseudobacteriovorax antillogorgiicola TaxID=1513793 RepID=A0A1Y6B3N5_9BACT|nr:inositol monophosphatase family protein [Pseudobacteriovorax antillogorgiicola]TCS59274.1 myo-inositol-1(or 4)-monophosphatase [Pseudobacteriovorax antillogorgiicola]SME89848.1 myo-inositol-1(or 4)-monophosphatase [Pseudobacteriovorax antillogorgiicola]